MRIRNHRIVDIWHNISSNISAGTISPKLVVTHYTTGWSGPASRNWLMGRAGGTANRNSSAHIVIDRDGSAWQIVPLNRRAWHAGPSKYGTLEDINSHSIGIEFVNPGWLRPDGHGGWLDVFSHYKSTAELEHFGEYLLAPHLRVSTQRLAWPLFTSVQIMRGLEILRAILSKYPIQAVVTHEEIDLRGEKTDPGPAFPKRAFVEQVLGRDNRMRMPKYRVAATRLNLRGGPGLNFERIDPPGFLPQDTLVRAIRIDSPWIFIETLEQQLTGAHEIVAGGRGWVHSSYLDQIIAG